MALCIAGNLPKVGTKVDQVVEVVGPRGFEYAGDERLLTSFGGEADELYRANKVPAFWIRFLDDEFGELELALQSQSLCRDTAYDRSAFSRHALDCGIGAVCLDARIGA